MYYKLFKRKAYQFLTRPIMSCILRIFTLKLFTNVRVRKVFPF